MESLSLNVPASMNTDMVSGIEVALSSSAQAERLTSGLGEPVEYILSPEYTPHEGFQWFFMHAAFGKCLHAQEEFSRHGIFSYVPYETVKVSSSDSQRKTVRKPMFNSYIFVLATLEDIKLFVNSTQTPHSLPYLHFVYDRTTYDDFGMNVRMTIPHTEMVNFIRLAEFDTYKVHRVDITKVNFVKDQPVLITQGVFKGIHGRVARVHNQTTVVVTLNGVVSMTTAYIPKHFMEPYEGEE